MLNPYEPTEAKIQNVILEAPGVKTFALKPKAKISFSPGQFILLTVRGVGEAPFTLSGSPYETTYLEITVAGAGEVTDKLHHLKKAGLVGIRGPYGKGYPVEKLYGRQILIVASGTGISRARSFLLTLLAQKQRFKRITLCYGAGTPEAIIYKEALERWMEDNEIDIYRTVEKADSPWKEAEGEVSALLDRFKMDLDNSAAVICGMGQMMKSSVFKLLQIGHKPENIYLSMEKNMCCGLGKCGHCGLGRFYVCKDGPVFNYDQIKDVHEIWG